MRVLRFDNVMCLGSNELDECCVLQTYGHRNGDNETLTHLAYRCWSAAEDRRVSVSAETAPGVAVIESNFGRTLMRFCLRAEVSNGGAAQFEQPTRLSGSV